MDRPRRKHAGGSQWARQSGAALRSECRRFHRRCRRKIAERILSDAERWADISKLNPALETAYPLRGGLLIKVPADARIPAANLPQTPSR